MPTSASGAFPGSGCGLPEINAALNISQQSRNLIGVADAKLKQTATEMNDPTELAYERLLVIRSQVDDQDAFRELLQRYELRLRCFVRRRIVSGDQVDDVIQEIWTDVFRQLPRLSDAGAFRNWLYRIAHGKIALVLRRLQLQPQATDDLEHADCPAEEPTFSADDATAIHAALNELSADHREVLILRFLEDMSCEEISQVVGVPPGTVRSRLYYAKLELKRQLQRSEED